MHADVHFCVSILARVELKPIFFFDLPQTFWTSEQSQLSMLLDYGQFGSIRNSILWERHWPRVVQKQSSRRRTTMWIRFRWSSNISCFGSWIGRRGRTQRWFYTKGEYGLEILCDLGSNQEYVSTQLENIFKFIGVGVSQKPKVQCYWS